MQGILNKREVAEENCKSFFDSVRGGLRTQVGGGRAFITTAPALRPFPLGVSRLLQFQLSTVLTVPPQIVKVAGRLVIQL
jgi:hypothetical protein